MKRLFSLLIKLAIILALAVWHFHSVAANRPRYTLQSWVLARYRSVLSERMWPVVFNTLPAGQT